MINKNIHESTVKGFGDEWERFDQSSLSLREQANLFESYFAIFPWNKVSKDAEGFDLGCGSGRWAKMVAPRVGKLHCIDPSSALEVARNNLAEFNNCIFHNTSVDEMSLENNSMDFGYSLGVLHHIPDTQAAMNECVSKLKNGAPFLVYLYYAFDNRPFWYRGIWKISEILRYVVSRLPHGIRYFVSQIIAVFVYYPITRIVRLMEKLGMPVKNMPLSEYRDKSFYTMRTDALDRFGTRLEQRFSKSDIKAMMKKSGLENITFSDVAPYWVAVGYRKQISK